MMQKRKKKKKKTEKGSAERSLCYFHRFLVSRSFPGLAAYLIDTHERGYKRCKSVLTLDARTTRPTIKGTTNKSSGHRV